jgi:hypothetical protein
MFHHQRHTRRALRTQNFPFERHAVVGVLSAVAIFAMHSFPASAPRFAQAMGVKGIQMVNINAGEKLTTNGFVIVPLSAPADSSEAAQYSFDLVYDTSTTEQQWALGGVVLTKTNPAGTKFTLVESCKELAGEHPCKKGTRQNS